MDSYRYIQEVVGKCYTYWSDIEYIYLRPKLKTVDILTNHQFCELDAIGPADTKIKKLFFDYCPTFDIENFNKLIDVIEEDYPHVSEKFKEAKENCHNQNEIASLPQLGNGRYAFSELPSQYHDCVITGNECQEDLEKLFASVKRDETLEKRPLLEHSPNESASQPRHSPASPHLKEETFSMECNPRGIALIINNINFKRMKKREGSDVDRDNLTKMFHFLGWHVTTKTDLRAKEMDMYMKKFAQLPSLHNVSAVAVVILTHGMDGDIYFGSDGEVSRNHQPLSGTYINRFELTENFNRSNCPAMKDKPKWFILQACRGSAEDTPQKQTKPCQPSGLDTDSPHSNDTKANRYLPLADKTRQPETGDMYYIFSSSLGFKSYRKRSGSPFINVLRETVEEFAASTEFDRIMKKVKGKFGAKQLEEEKMTLPEYSSTSFRDWYLRPVGKQCYQ